MEYIKNTVNTVVNAFTTTPPQNTLSRSDIVNLEESERSRRLEQVSQSKLDQQNASELSGLIRSQSFPVFKGQTSTGYKRVTTRFEEDERRRRLTNKSESALRRGNANQTARMIQGLGWPFYQQNKQGAEYLYMDPTKLLEEEERAWRMSSSYWAPTAKHNAAMVANTLRWANFQRNPSKGWGYHLKYLEEKERRDRLRPEFANNAMEHAYNEAGLIRAKGAPFYVQERPIGKRDFSEIHKLEEQERSRRMFAQDERQLAHELAGVVSGRSTGQNLDVEEQERGRRLKDTAQQHIAKENAKHVSLMVRESSSNKLGGGSAPLWFSISRNSMRALEEIERTRRLRDIEGQRYARSQAKLISEMVGRRIAAPPKPSIHAIEEGERQNRLLDRAGQQLAMKNARKISGLVARHLLMSSTSKSYALALEESERTRRLQDFNAQELAKNNARKVSSLVSSLSVAPGNHREIPASTEKLPEYHASSAPSTAVNIPSSAPLQKAPLQSAPLQQSAPIQQSVAPIQSAPIQAAPIVTPIVPVGAPIITPVPVTTLPSQSERSAFQSPLTAPVMARSVSASHVNSSPSVQPIVLPTTQAPVPVAPLATTGAPIAPLGQVGRQQSFPNMGSAYTSVPADPSLTAHSALGERQRKKLEKQVEKHNKKSEKDVLKAEKSMLKAEKLHQKGRDAKAAKMEGKAEQFMKQAEHERRWASGLQSELSNAPAPASM